MPIFYSYLQNQLLPRTTLVLCLCQVTAYYEMGILSLFYPYTIPNNACIKDLKIKIRS